MKITSVTGIALRVPCAPIADALSTSTARQALLVRIDTDAGLFGIGEAAISCHGVTLTPCEAETPDDGHRARIDIVEDEYCVRIAHDMTKDHYISFIAAFTPDGIQLIKLYPEQDAIARFPRRGIRRLAFYCNRDGLFRIAPPAVNFQRKKNDPGQNSVRLNDTVEPADKT